MKKLNIGCGKDIQKGYINLDVVNLKGVDVIHDLDKFPYPFKDNTFNQIRCFGVIEHLKELIKVMEEIHRISSSNALIQISVPYFNSVEAFADPTHKHFFTLDTFDYFTDNHPFNFYTKARFKVIKKELVPTKFGKIIPFKKLLLNKIGMAFKGVVCAIRFELITIK